MLVAGWLACLHFDPFVVCLFVCLPCGGDVWANESMKKQQHYHHSSSSSSNSSNSTRKEEDKRKEWVPV